MSIFHDETFARLAVPNAIDSMRGYEQTDDYLAWRNRSEGKYLHRHGPVAPAAEGRGANARPPLMPRAILLTSAWVADRQHSSMSSKRAALDRYATVTRRCQPDDPAATRASAPAAKCSAIAASPTGIPTMKFTRSMAWQA